MNLVYKLTDYLSGEQSPLTLNIMSIFNTPQMGGILTNYCKVDEDRQAASDMKELINEGKTKDEAIAIVSDKYRIREHYLLNLLNGGL